MAVQLVRVSINATGSIFNALYTVPAGQQLAVSRIFGEPPPGISATLRINGVALINDNIGTGSASATLNNFGKLTALPGDVIEINPSAGGYITLCGELVAV